MKPLKLLVYYGWLNAFNSAVNGWDNDKVAMEMARYNLLVFGSGLADPSHGDFANTSAIIAKIKTLNPTAKIFGYVDATLDHELAQYSTSSESSQTEESESSESSSPTVDELSTASSQSTDTEATSASSESSEPVLGEEDLTDFALQVRQWEALQVDGIFFDQAGYDFGSVETNGRLAMNEKVAYVHSMTYANTCFMNAWNLDHVLTLENDVSYPNSSWNPDLVPSELKSRDWYLFESFAYDVLHNPGGAEDEHYETRADWYARASKVSELMATEDLNNELVKKVNIAAISRIDPAATGKQAYLEFAYRAAAMWRFHAFGSADPNYGASTAKTLYYTRPELPEDVYSPNPIVTHPDNADAYVKFYEHALLVLDFTDGAEDATLTKF